MRLDQGQAGAEIEITREMIFRAAEALIQSGALAEPVIGVAALAERVLRKGLLRDSAASKGSSADWMPSKIAVQIDRCL